MLEIMFVLELLRALNLAMEIVLSILEIQRKRKSALEAAKLCQCTYSSRKSSNLLD